MYKESLIENKPEILSGNLLPISAQSLSEKFGPTSAIYSNSVKRLENLLEKVKYEPSIKARVNDWTSTIEILYGYKPDLSLFLDHTYLFIIAKTGTYLKLNSNKPDKKEIIKVVSGKYFIEKGVTNFIDNFSLWLLNSKIEQESLDLLWTFVEILSNYDYSKVDEDIFRELYEEIIERRERHKVGEYYTPEWLVELILKEVFSLWEQKEGKTFPRILDPACGSGTFLYRAIKILREKRASIGDIIKNVEGTDINPIAAIIAKANYLIAIGDMIKDSGEMTLPINIKDCLKSPDLFDNVWKIEKYNIILGNPPWVVMRSMKSKEYQNFLKREVLKYQLLENRDLHLFTQVELATLFFCKCADLYLEKGGIIAFVMPRSVLAGTMHHINFRKFRDPLMKLMKIIDLEDVSPLFNIPSCVLIGSKGGITEYPVLLERYNGELSSTNGKFSEAKAKLSVGVCKYTPPDFSVELSYYHDKFKVGASIFPRSLYFVDFISPAIPSLGFSVKTSEEIYQIVKEPWKVILEGNIEDDFLYATLLAWEMFPFGYVNLRSVMLPIKEDSSGYTVMDINSLQRNGFRRTAEWLKKAQTIWDKRKTKKSEKRFPSLLDRLNYNSLLTVQNPSLRYIVLYNATGTNVVSCVIDKHFLPYFGVNGQKVEPKGFVVDVKTWFFETNNKMEAYYLCAIFNSEIISKIIKPLQPKGLFGARAIHRRPLLFPIPKFNENDHLHLKLVNISKKCHDKIKHMEFTQKNNIRAEARKKLRDEIMKINQIVSKILKIRMEE